MKFQKKLTHSTCDHAHLSLRPSRKHIFRGNRYHRRGSSNLPLPKTHTTITQELCAVIFKIRMPRRWRIAHKIAKYESNSFSRMPNCLSNKYWEIHSFDVAINCCTLTECVTHTHKRFDSPKYNNLFWLFSFSSLLCVLREKVNQFRNRIWHSQMQR